MREDRVRARAREGREHRQRGQSLVEFSIGSIVLVLLLGGLIDFSRAFYFDLGLHGAAWAGARHGAWFDFGHKQNLYLDDKDIVDAVNQGLAGSGIPTVAGAEGTCPAGLNNSSHNPPYDSSYYPTTPGTVKLYLCYTKPGSASAVGTLGNNPPLATDYSWRGGDVNVIILMDYGLVLSFMQNALNATGGIHVASNAHFLIEGGY